MTCISYPNVNHWLRLTVSVQSGYSNQNPVFVDTVAKKCTIVSDVEFRRIFKRRG